MPAPSDDAVLVARLTAGDRDALGEVFDRHGGAVHSLCLTMLRHHDDAADATADVFLLAGERIGQLRQPDRLKSWLYAIARHEVYRRSRRTKREVLTAEVDDMTATMIPRGDSDADLPLDPTLARQLLDEAALGLDDRDRMAMELALAGSLDGEDLAAALDVSLDAAHQANHRMRGRLGRSIGALLVARQGRADCDALDALLGKWDGTFSVLWRKRVARHVDGCERCEHRAHRIPAAVLNGSAFSVVGVPIAFHGPPAWVRERVVSGDHGATPRMSLAWTNEGFPTAERRRLRRTPLLIALAGLLAIGGAMVLALDRPDTVADNTPTPTVASTRRPTTTIAPPTVAPTTMPAPPLSVVPATPVPVSDPPPPPPTPTAAPTTTVPPDRTPPVIDADIPSTLLFARAAASCGPNPDIVAAVTDASAVSSVTLTAVPVSGGAVITIEMVPGGSPNEWRTRLDPPDPRGSYDVTIAAVDASGNQAEPVSRPVAVTGCIR